MEQANSIYFAEAASKVFSTMLGMEVECQGSRVMADGSPTADVTGIVTYSGDLLGSMILTFPNAVIKEIVKRFACIESDVSDPDFLDAVGELANMVAGQAKSRFDGFSAMISIPTVVYGPNHHVSRRKTEPWVVIPASCEIGKFVVAMSLEESKA